MVYCTASLSFTYTYATHIIANNQYVDHCRFSDLLGLYQALSLVVPMQPDLEIDTELRVELLTVQAAFAQMISERSSGQPSV